METGTTQELVETYKHAVVGVAHRLYRSAGTKLSHRDLVAHGFVGLLEAFARYDPALGAQFWTFAFPRVRGAMLDAIRREMPVPLSAHRPMRAARDAVASTPTGTKEWNDASDRLTDACDAAALLGAEILSIAFGQALAPEDDELRRAYPHASDRFVTEPARAKDDRVSDVVRTDAADAHEQLVAAIRDEAVRDALACLTIEERMVVRGLYFEERGLLEIGAELGVSKSWASRIHTRALRRLEELLARDHGDLDERREPRPGWDVPRSPELVEVDALDEPGCVPDAA